MLPDVTKSDLEKEVINLYSFGIVSGLEVLFGFKKEKVTHVNEKLNTAANHAIDHPFDNSSDDASDVVNPFVDKRSDVSNSHKERSDANPLLHRSENSVDPFQNTSDFPHPCDNNSNDASPDCVKQEINPEELLDQSITDFGNDSVYKVDIKVEDELQHHSFEIISSKRENTSSPGILIVDNKFKYFSQTECGGKFSYQCALRRQKKCPARALVQRDDSGQLVVLKCSTDDAHNHEASKVDMIVRKMNTDMVEMIKSDPSLTARECLAAAKVKFSMETDAQLWPDVMAHWDKPMKFRSLQTTLQRAKKSALGLSGSLLKHMREVGGTEQDRGGMMIGRAVITTQGSSTDQSYLSYPQTQNFASHSDQGYLPYTQDRGSSNTSNSDQAALNNQSQFN